MSNTADKPKIIVDEDWKTQVQAEREAARQPGAPSSTIESPTAPGSVGQELPQAAGGSSTSPGVSSDLPDVPLPPPSLSFLCSTIATQAMLALGQFPNPLTGKLEVRPQQAKHFIDTLAMLEEKTANNRTAEESALLDELLHQLRMGYVMLQNSAQG